MKAIETSVVVTDDKKVTISVPEDIPSGEHKVILIIDEKRINSPAEAGEPELKLKVLKWSNWPANCAFKREDIYNDAGR